MPQVTEVRRFAGQDVVVTRAARASDTKAGAATTDEGLDKPKGGMDAVLATLAGPKKVNVLDKTRSDWTDFKTADTDIDAELEAHKRSAAQVGRDESLSKEQGVPAVSWTPFIVDTADAAVPGKASLPAAGRCQAIRSGARSETSRTMKSVFTI